MDYTSAKLGDCTCSRFGFIALNVFSLIDPVTFDLIFIGG